VIRTGLQILRHYRSVVPLSWLTLIIQTFLHNSFTGFRYNILYIFRKHPTTTPYPTIAFVSRIHACKIIHRTLAAAHHSVPWCLHIADRPSDEDGKRHRGSIYSTFVCHTHATYKPRWHYRIRVILLFYMFEQNVSTRRFGTTTWSDRKLRHPHHGRAGV